MSTRGNKRRGDARGSKASIGHRTRVRKSGELLAKMGALDRLGEQPVAEAARERLRQEAAAMGLRIESVTIVHEPIPDPAIESLPAHERKRLESVSHRMYEDPASLRGELRALMARHPNLPLLRNHLASALNSAGEHDQAAALVAETHRLFPDYLFGFCNYVLMLLQDGKLDEARQLIETGPRGPLFTLSAFDPSRSVFHVSEATSYACMAGHYLASTGREDAARVQLRMLKQLDHDSPQARSLSERLERSRMLEVVLKAIERVPTGRRARKPRSR